MHNNQPPLQARSSPTVVTSAAPQKFSIPWSAYRQPATSTYEDFWLHFCDFATVTADTAADEPETGEKYLSIFGRSGDVCVWLWVRESVRVRQIQTRLLPTQTPFRFAHITHRFRAQFYALPVALTDSAKEYRSPGSIITPVVHPLSLSPRLYAMRRRRRWISNFLNVILRSIRLYWQRPRRYTLMGPVWNGLKKEELR